MYNCQVCGRPSKPNERQFAIVVKTKKIRHPYRSKVHRIKVEDKWEYIDDPGGNGDQIVREMKVCSDCQHYSPDLAAIK